MSTEVNHWRRFALWWAGTSIVGTLLVVLVLAPGLPPGNGTVESSGQVADNTVLLGLSTPVAALVIVFLIYAVIAFRERDSGSVLEGPKVLGDSRVQTWWLAVTGALVLFLAVFGTIGLEGNGAGGGQGPNPLAKPASGTHVLQVQVIAQQWKFTYRWPAYGGVETSTLDLPAHTHDRVPCHLARRHPLVLGLPARRQGRRQPGRRQHRLRHHQVAADASRSTARSSAASGTATCTTPAHVVPQAQFASWIASRRSSTRRRPSRCRRTRNSTSRIPRGEVDDRNHDPRPAAASRMAPAHRLQPAHRDRAGGRRMAVGDLIGTRSTRRASATTAPTPARTTSASCSAICSG